MKLKNVEMVCSHPLQTGFEISPDDILVPDMFGFQVVLMLDRRTAAFGGENEFLATRTDESADPLFGNTVIRRGIDEVDSRVQYEVQKLFRRGIADNADSPGFRTSQSHASVAELADAQTCSPELFSDHFSIVSGRVI